MTVMVTGGAGYIGSHVVRLLTERGDDVVVVDDLSTGIPDRVAELPLEIFDLSEPGAVDALKRVIAKYNVDSVIHFAAKKMVGESVENPIMYYRQNIDGLTNLLEALQLTGVDKLVFSSSAAVYGIQDRQIIDESHASQKPASPYGETKLVGEWLIDAVCAASSLRAINLRYFNVAGAGWPELADTAVMNLVPIVLERFEQSKPAVVFGDDYGTEDGTCIRDYIHVKDLADAHLAALDALAAGTNARTTYNVGTGNGSSVLEVIQALSDAMGEQIPYEMGDRRPGDPAALVADPTAIREDLGWKAEFGLREIAESAVAARNYHG